MDLKAILYSHKLHSFNISKDLRYIAMNSNILYIADIVNGEIYTIGKDNAILDSAFSDDNSFIAIKSDYKYFLLHDNFTKKQSVRKSGSSFFFKKPVVYKDGFMYAYDTFVTDRRSYTKYILQNNSKKTLLFEIYDCFLYDNKIFDDELYVIFGDHEKDQIFICQHNFITNTTKQLEFTITEAGFRNAIVIPQKGLLVILFYCSDDMASLCFYDINTFRLVHKEKLDIIAVLPNLCDMCNGEYLIISHLKGFMIFNTTDFSLEKDVYFPRIREVTVCDNDNFCCIRCWDDFVVFTPTQSPENDELIKKIEDLFRSNGLNRLINKRNG